MSSGTSVQNPWLPFVVAVLLMALFGVALGFVSWETLQLTNLANSGVAGVDARLQLWMSLATGGFGVLWAAFTSAVGFFFGNRGAEGARQGESRALHEAEAAKSRAETAEEHVRLLRRQVLDASADLVAHGGKAITPVV
jgi:hypothetical protein